MDPFSIQLAELCCGYPTGAKWVFVPSRALGHTLGERLVLGGTNWANLRFTTPLELALRTAAPFLIERGVTPAEDTVGAALLMRLLSELRESTPQYFRPMADQPQMVEALWATIQELRMAGIRAADLRAAAFADSAKHTELRALLAAYEVHLAEHHVADAAAVLEEALRHIDAGPVLSTDVWTEVPGVLWAPLQAKFLDALPGTRFIPRTRALPGVARPRRLTRPAVAEERTAASDAERLGFLMSPGTALPPKGDGTLAMFRAGGPEAEVEEVFRRILGGEIAFDHVEIACASLDHVDLVWEKCERHEWPVTVGPGLPITRSRPARALYGFWEWIEAGFSASGLRRLLQSGDVRLDVEAAPTAGQAARLLARSRATWGRETYAVSLAALGKFYRERATDGEADDEERARDLERAAHAERLAEWIGALLALVPEPLADGRIRLRDLLEGAATFVTSVAAKSSEVDGEASTVIVEALHQLAPLGDLLRRPSEALGLLRHQVESVRIAADRARPGHLFATMLRQAGYSGRSHTFVVGLEEGRVFPALLEDAVLLDEEREAISSALATSRDHVSEALYDVVGRLGSLGGKVCLSFSCRDLRHHRETFPSWLLLQAQRLIDPGRDWTYQTLNEALGEPVSVVPARPGQALSMAGWWLANLKGVGPAAMPAIHAAFPWLSAGELAEAARDSDLFTIFDGLVRTAATKLDPRRPGHIVSTTTLEGFAKCPFGHFVRRGLGIDPLSDAEPERDRWLDGATRGTLLHGLYATILREVRDRGERLDPQRHGARLRELGETRLRELRALIPPPSDHVFERERQEILNDLELFIRLEVSETARTPVGFEVCFGTGATEGEPLSRLEAVDFDLGAGDRFKLRGKIDRIDRLADGSYEVTDYKTGWHRDGEFEGTFQGGRLLQHALYALAATELLRRADPGARVSRSSYYQPTVRGRGERVTCPPVSRELVAAVLHDLFEVLAAGAFLPTSEKKDCRRCELGRACGPEPFKRAAQKTKCDANGVLGSYRRLVAHE